MNNDNDDHTNVVSHRTFYQMADGFWNFYVNGPWYRKGPVEYCKKSRSFIIVFWYLSLYISSPPKSPPSVKGITLEWYMLHWKFTSYIERFRNSLPTLRETSQKKKSNVTTYCVLQSTIGAGREL